MSTIKEFAVEAVFGSAQHSWIIGRWVLDTLRPAEEGFTFRWSSPLGERATSQAVEPAAYIEQIAVSCDSAPPRSDPGWPR